MSRIPAAFICRIAIMSVAIWAPSLLAQSTKNARVAQPTADREGWHVSPGLRIAGTFDDNPFLLSDAKKAGVDAPSTSSVTSGRYSSMAGASDFITSLRGSLNAEGAGILGHKLILGADARYEYYQRNAKRRNMFYEVSAEQAIGHGTHIGARAEILPSYFFRNYLADAVDLNADGTIQSAERVYAAGTYSDQEFTGEIRHRLAKSSDDHAFGAQLTIDGGYKTRTYQQPFQTRGYSGPFAGVAAALDLTPSVGLEGGYHRASLAATPGTTVLLLNEPDFNRDFNGNGTMTDLRVRSVQMVDFSRIEQDIDARARAHMSEAVETTLSYSLRLRNFESKQPYDVYNNTRRDRRDRLGLELAYRFSPRMSVRVGGRGEIQKLTNTLRPSAAIDDITDYTRKGFYISWSRQL